MKLKHIIFTNNDRMKIGNRLTIDACRKISAAQGNECRLREHKDRSREMHFNYSFIQFISQQYICYLHGILVHRPGWIDTKMLVAVATHILYGIQYSCLDNFYTHDSS